MTAEQAEHQAGPNGKGTLYVVATPIGNLGDITFRAVETLRAVALVAAEDTRVTARLLGHLGLAKSMLSVREHNERAGAQKIVEALARGESVALVTDAGTPAVSDPGAHVVAAVREAGFAVVPIPGPSALVAALSASGLAAPHFLYYGFLPAKAGERRSALAGLKELPYTLVFYESPHRIGETLADLAATLGAERRVVIARELTKLFEQIHLCVLGEAADWLAEDANRQKGEFVLIVSGAELEAGGDAEPRRVLEILLRELPLSQAAKLAAEITGGKKKALYDLALRLKGGA
jgi:16S rRNA (cytidine1402-2'-O)-methyltransferase